MSIPDRLAGAARSITGLASRVPIASRFRRPLAAALLAVAAMAAVSLLLPEGSGEPVVVVTADLPPGHTLSSGDVKVAHFPGDLVPGGAITDVDEVDGRVLAAGATTGTPLTTRGLVGSQSLTADAGEVLVPVRISDAQAAGILQPGNHVSLYSSALDSLDGSSELILERVTVAQISVAPASTLTSTTGALLTVIATPDEARALAAAQGTQLSFALLPG